VQQLLPSPATQLCSPSAEPQWSEKHAYTTGVPWGHKSKESYSFGEIIILL
jgi:hypothetical protein